MLAIWFAIGAQFVAMGIWVGTIQAEVTAQAEWIRDRKAVNIDSRLAVLESFALAIDRHVDHVDDVLQKHVREDDQRLRSLR